MTEPVFKKLVREVVKEELAPFEKRFSKRFDEFEKRINNKFTLFKDEVKDEFKEILDETFRKHSHEMLTHLDKVMGRIKQYDEEHAILRQDHGRILSGERQLEKLEEMHTSPHPHLSK